ncbi:hypothetical protein KIN20_008106 [Parelaphostrongylus tenuis]|uniref:Uncharacterized protein n=1 Tax=Parelaphostrongylus tenuis TaxID=148309 RepID=A0AAD5QMG5_PARTN|nr:hypothetical protein KIN20_008106 [Parelaphostrongylus tenuis]
MKLFAARTAIDLHPKLILSTREKLCKERYAPTNPSNESPGVLSLHAAQILETNRVGYCCRIHSWYDNKWKSCYTDVFLVDKGRKTAKPKNRQGWVVPLKNICDKVGLSSKFFTANRKVTLQEARAQVLKSRLEMSSEPSAWLMEYDPLATKNLDLMSYIGIEFDPRALQSRLALFNEQIYSDRDRVRVSVKYHNHTHMGKLMFGPSKKQKFICSITGGMERRFEILDNQVNHLPFTHEAFDQNLDKCRNYRVKCRDSSRVILRYPGGATNTFIHANYVCGGPLFNKFIVTQAPMENTIGDFWRMVWQERASYIFMLISRKDTERCAPYWPRHPESSPLSVYGLHIHNVGISFSRDPIFRVTYIRIVDDFGDEHRVEHWQADMNNSSNLSSPLSILRLARNSSQPVIVHDCLGISRSACVVSTEIAICSIIRGPTYKHPIQKAVHFLRLQRPFSVETPMQYIYIHRCVQQFFSKISEPVRAMEEDYQKWLGERAGRMFVDDLGSAVPGYRLLSPRVDPDLLRLVRHPPRPNIRREAPDCVGELPLP